MDTYRVVRHYQYGQRKRTIATGLTLEQAQAHCANPETSSKTATSLKARHRTQVLGPWFDGYTKEYGPKDDKGLSHLLMECRLPIGFTYNG